MSCREGYSSPQPQHDPRIQGTSFALRANVNQVDIRREKFVKPSSNSNCKTPRADRQRAYAAQPLASIRRLLDIAQDDHFPIGLLRVLGALLRHEEVHAFQRVDILR